jgi:hypothetical protein
VPCLEAVPLLGAAQVDMALFTPQPGALQAARKFAAAADLGHKLRPVVRTIQAHSIRDISPNRVTVFSAPNGLRRWQAEIYSDLSIFLTTEENMKKGKRKRRKR